MSLNNSNTDRPVKDTVQTPEYEAPRGTQEEGSKHEGLGTNPEFSMAGSGAQNPNNHNQAPYIDKEYDSYNPQYNQPDEGPTWSLAQPFPHIMRPGMRHGALPEDRDEDKEAMHNGDPIEDPEVKKQRSVESRMNRVNAPNQDGFFNTWSKIRHYLREPLAEWLGTTMSMTIGLCATLSNFTSQGQAGSYPAQCLAWGFGIMVAIYTTGGISGGHMNPAITITLSVFRGFPAGRCVVYIAAQLLGAITAGGISYALYHDSIVNAAASSKVPQNASIAVQALITAPKAFVQPATAFFTEFVGSALLVGAILALGDDHNAPPGAGMQAFILGILISIVILALGYNTGGSFNCARDFGPRLVAVMAGWGGNLFRESHAWWIWGPWCADITGALFGALVYDMAIFTGGESLVNYPPRRRKRAYRVRALNFKKKLRFRKNKVADLERSVRETEE